MSSLRGGGDSRHQRSHDPKRLKFLNVTVPWSDLASRMAVRYLKTPAYFRTQRWLLVLMLLFRSVEETDGPYSIVNDH